MQVIITYDPDTETLSVDPTAYAGTTADNDSSEVIIEGLVGDLMDWTADLVFPIVSSSSCNPFYPMARLDQTRIYSLPNALLSLCRDGILPVQLRLTKDERIKWSRNTVRIDVSKIVDAVGSIGDAFPLHACLKGDTASWSRSIVYEEGAIVERDGYLYRSTDSNNLGNDPETPESTWWSPIDVAAPYYSGLFGDGEQTAIDVRHKLNTEELAWSVYLDGSYTEDVIVTVIDADNVRFSFDHAPSYNSVHVVIMPAFRVVGHGIRIKGPLLVDGDITNMGGAHIIYTDEMHTKKAMIYLREDATIGLLPEELSGLRFVRYDGTHDGILAVDSRGTAYVGDEGDLQPIATRADADEMTDDLPVVWDSIGSKMVTRELVAGDIPDLDAGKIISGTISDERIPSGITRDTELTAHTSRTDNPHSVTKSQVDLGNVDNTSDVNKPISTATQTALNAKQDNLTFDTVPTTGSTNPVTSGGVKTELDGKVSKTGNETINGVKVFTEIPESHGGAIRVRPLIPNETYVDLYTTSSSASNSKLEIVTRRGGPIRSYVFSANSDGNDSYTTTLMRSSPGNTDIVNKGYLDTRLSPLAVDSTVVHKTGNESIAGIKTFSDNVEIGTTLVPKQLSIKGNLLIDGNITQNGSTYETHAQQVHTTDDKIIMRDGATAGLIAGDTSGLTFKKYDGTNDGELSVDSSGIARVGDVGDLQPLATRGEAGSMTDDLPVVWDAADLKLVTRQLTRSDVGLSAYPLQPSDLPVSSATQTALDAKQDTITGAATTITSADLTKSRALISNTDGKVAVSAVQSSELGRLSGVTSNIQTQLDGKQATLTFDSTPTASSTNPVTSGGVFTALQQNATPKYSTTFSGTGSATSFPITHSLNDAYPIVTVWKTSGGATKVVDVEIQSTSVNQITLVFAVAPATTDSFDVRVIS